MITRPAFDNQFTDMNRNLTFAFLVVATLSGCVVQTNGGYGNSGGGDGSSGYDITFAWTFDGTDCSANPEIATVTVTMPGQQLMNAGVFPCTSNAFPGIVLHDFVDGSYPYSITAADSSGAALFTTSSTVVVSGNDTRVNANLTPASGPNSYALLSWTFPPLGSVSAPDCSQAGVATVSYSIDGANAVASACDDGFGAQAVQTANVEPGTHSLTVSAVDASGTALYSYSGSLQTFAGNPVSASIPLVSLLGGAVVRWTIEDASGTQSLSCAQAGLSTVFVNFNDGTHWLLDGLGEERPCTDLGVVFSNLAPGTLSVNVTGTGTGGTTYQSEANPAPGVVVTAGDFPDGSVDGPNVVNVIIHP